MCIFYYNETGATFLAHGVGCLAAFFMGYRPFVHSFAAVVLMFEASTIFLNIHWFCDKTDRSGSTLQWINGIVLLFVFFSVRIVYGTLRIYSVVSSFWVRYNDCPAGTVEFYTLAGIGICALNFWWFFSMVRSVLSRFKVKKE
jgi:hypothetical protein